MVLSSDRALITHMAARTVSSNTAGALKTCNVAWLANTSLLLQWNVNSSIQLFIGSNATFQFVGCVVWPEVIWALGLILLLVTNYQVGMMLQALARGRLPVQVVGAAIAACGKHRRWQEALEFRSGRRELVGKSNVRIDSWAWNTVGCFPRPIWTNLLTSSLWSFKRPVYYMGNPKELTRDGCKLPLESGGCLSMKCSSNIFFIFVVVQYIL